MVHRKKNSLFHSVFNFPPISPPPGMSQVIFTAAEILQKRLDSLLPSAILTLCDKIERNKVCVELFV